MKCLICLICCCLVEWRKQLASLIEEKKVMPAAGSSTSKQQHFSLFINSLTLFYCYSWIELNKNEVNKGTRRVGWCVNEWVSWLAGKDITIYAVIWRVKLFNEGSRQPFTIHSTQPTQRKLNFSFHWLVSWICEWNQWMKRYYNSS